MKDRVFGPKPSGFAFRVPWPRRPAVTQPDRDRVACRSGRVAAGVQREFSPEFGFPVDKSDAVQNLMDRRAEKLVASRGDFDLALAQRGLPRTKLAVPLGALGGLKAELVTHAHHHRVTRQGVQGIGHPLAKWTGVGGHVGNQQVGQRDGVRPHPGVHERLARELADQEDEPAQIAPEPAFLRAVVGASVCGC